MLMPELCLSMIRADKPFKSYVTGQARRSQHSNMLNCNNKKINIQADGFMVITPRRTSTLSLESSFESQYCQRQSAEKTIAKNKIIHSYIAQKWKGNKKQKLQNCCNLQFCNAECTDCHRLKQKPNCRIAEGRMGRRSAELQQSTLQLYRIKQKCGLQQTKKVQNC